MSKATVCDNCETVASDFNDRDPQDNWLNVGWFSGPRFDVCSAVCAKILIDKITELRATIDAELEDEAEAEEAEEAALALPEAAGTS